MKNKKNKSDAVLKSERHGYKSQRQWQHLTSPEKLKKHQEEMDKKRSESESPPLERTQTVNVSRAPNGQLLPGSCLNTSGRPTLGTNRLELLLNAIRKVETKENKKLLEHFVEKAYKDNGVLVALIKKLHPDLQAIAWIPSRDDNMNDSEAADIRKKLQERYLKSESETPSSSELDT
jgi:hypothetical protein